MCVLVGEPCGAGPSTMCAGCLGRSRRASLRVVPFSATRLMLWLAGCGDEPAETRGGTGVLVAPSITGWIRPATAAETAAWRWLAVPRPLPAATGTRATPIRTLCQAGAVLAPDLS